MLDIKMLDTSLKLKAIGRLSVTQHPFLKLINAQIDYEQYFSLKSNAECECFSKEGLIKLNKIRRMQLSSEADLPNSVTLTFLRKVKISEVITQLGKNSLLYFNLRRRGKLNIGDMNVEDLHSIERFIHKDIAHAVRRAVATQVRVETHNHVLSIMNCSKNVNILTSTSKAIRDCLSTNAPICLYKFGSVMTPVENNTWCHSLRKVTSVRHRGTLLRVAHGDIYSKTRLWRFGLSLNPNCPRCGELDDPQHKVLNCQYVRLIWRETMNLTDKLRNQRNSGVNDIIENKVLGASSDTSPLVLTVHAEILQRILALKEDMIYLIRPKHFVKLTIENLTRCEKNEENKSALANLLND